MSISMLVGKHQPLSYLCFAGKTILSLISFSQALPTCTKCNSLDFQVSTSLGMLEVGSQKPRFESKISKFL